MEIKSNLEWNETVQLLPVCWLAISCVLMLINSINDVLTSFRQGAFINLIDLSPADLGPGPQVNAICMIRHQCGQLDPVHIRVIKVKLLFRVTILGVNH